MSQSVYTIYTLKIETLCKIKIVSPLYIVHIIKSNIQINSICMSSCKASTVPIGFIPALILKFGTFQIHSSIG